MVTRSVQGPWADKSEIEAGIIVCVTRTCERCSEVAKPLLEFIEVAAVAACKSFIDKEPWFFKMLTGYIKEQSGHAKGKGKKEPSQSKIKDQAQLIPITKYVAGGHGILDGQLAKVPIITIMASGLT